MYILLNVCKIKAYFLIIVCYFYVILNRIILKTFIIVFFEFAQTNRYYYLIMFSSYVNDIAKYNEPIEQSGYFYDGQSINKAISINKKYGIKTRTIKKTSIASQKIHLFAVLVLDLELNEWYNRRTI